jgi:glycosyltransferase involved in cell wall biosynthesis
LVIAPQLGFEPDGSLIPGGLLSFGRCVVRALASSPKIEKLGVWSQVDHPVTEAWITRMIRVHAHDGLDLDVRGFKGSRTRLALSIQLVSFRRTYDRVMYLLVNQSVLSILPLHLPYDVWEIGEELFQPVPYLQYRALVRADRLLSISRNTAHVAALNNPGLPEGIPVHLCLEPPLYEPSLPQGLGSVEPYDPASRQRSVLIVANMHQRLMYKGHQQLIDGWQTVVDQCPEAELWIVGHGDGRHDLESRARELPAHVARRIIFFGRLDKDALDRAYRTCRVFAMPSTREGFGLVFVEAARHGVPCIGGKHDSVKETVLRGQTGLLVEQRTEDVAAACVRLLADDDLARRLGNAGQQRYLDHFQFHHFCNRLLRAIEL